MTKIKEIISSYTTMVILLLIYATAMGAATAIEKFYGTETAKSVVYHSWPFIVLHILLVINFIANAIKYKFFKAKRISYIVVHSAFIVMLLGAMTSFLWSFEGILHLREGETRNEFVVTSKGDGMTTHKLPFSVELEEFNIHRYPGSDSPSSYESNLIIHSNAGSKRELIYMNNVLDINGYRLYQASFDTDEGGTVLSINRDVAGRRITYLGYALLLLGMILSLTHRNSRFARLWRELRGVRSKSLLLLALLIAGSSQLNAQEVDQETATKVINTFKVSERHAKAFGELPMQSTRGRIMPINTFSSEVLRKVHKSNSVEGMSPEAFLLSYMVISDIWAQYPLIATPSGEVASELGIGEEYCAYTDLFDSEGKYKLQEHLTRIYDMDVKSRTTFDKDILKLDERVNTLYLLCGHKLLNIFPNEADVKNKWYAPGDDLTIFEGRDSLFVNGVGEWYLEEVGTAMTSGEWSEPDRLLGMIETYQDAKDSANLVHHKRLHAEVLYNSLNIFKWCKMASLIFGGLLLVLSILALFRESWISKAFTLLLSFGILLSAIYQAFGVALRWYIAGNGPSSSYETMILVSLAVVIVGLIFARRSTITFALASILGGVILFVSSLSWMDPHITPLVPVLKSPWLISHVTMIIVAYGFMGISALIGVTNMVLLSLRSRSSLINLRVKELSIINEMSLWLGLAFLAIGIFLGAIWANESWGRYWGWDPKEVWALITMILYATILHLHLIKKYNTLWHINFFSTAAFSSVLMTYFGVNTLLSGMHSYGNSQAPEGLLLYIIAAATIVGIVGAAAWRSGGKLS